MDVFSPYPPGQGWCHLETPSLKTLQVIIFEFDVDLLMSLGLLVTSAPGPLIWLVHIHLFLALFCRHLLTPPVMPPLILFPNDILLEPAVSAPNSRSTLSRTFVIFGEIGFFSTTLPRFARTQTGKWSLPSWTVTLNGQLLCHSDHHCPRSLTFGYAMPAASGMDRRFVLGIRRDPGESRWYRA